MHSKFSVQSTRFFCSMHSRLIVTILNASTKLGKNLVLLLKQNPHVKELRLHGDDSIVPVAEDVSYIDTCPKVRSYQGYQVLKYALQDSDIVLSLGHLQNGPQELKKNAEDICKQVFHMTEANCNGIFCITQTPIESLVPLASEEFEKYGKNNSKKIIGISAFANLKVHFYLTKLLDREFPIWCPIVGGLSSKTIIPVLSQCKPSLPVNNVSLNDLLKVISIEEEENLFDKANSSNLSPALAIYKFLCSIISALRGQSDCVECAFVKQSGSIGKFLPYMTSLIRLDNEGINSTYLPKMNKDEVKFLKEAAKVLKSKIQIGLDYQKNHNKKTT